MFKINQVCYDSENKEFVKITNGIPVIEGKPEITPTEAIALRVISLNKGKPVIAFTYRKVNPAHLKPYGNDDGTFEAFTQTEKPVHFEFMGRV